VPARVLDLEEHRARLAEAYAAEHGPLRFAGVELSPDGESVLLELDDRDDPIELTGAAALALGRQLVALGEWLTSKPEDWPR